jgi:uncharacterized membrane protein
MVMANFHVYLGQTAGADLPVIRKVTPSDIKDALARGFDDFREMPSHLLFLGLIYPICGMVLAYVTSQQNVLQLLFPLASGFALVGPFAAIGLYEMSRRRELGLDTSWRHAFEVIRSPSIPSIIALGLALVAIFALWLAAAQVLYALLFGPMPPASYMAFLTDIFSSGRGWALILIGCFIGFCFAVVAFSISVVAFPLLLDRDVGVGVAVGASVKTVLANPVTMALWGLTVTLLLLIGSLPLFLGLVVVMPVLGHATWHMYRKAIERDPSHEHMVDWPADRVGRPASQVASAHSVLFPWPKSES